MNKILNKLVTGLSLLSFLSFSPVSMATNIDNISQNLSSGVSSVDETQKIDDSNVNILRVEDSSKSEKHNHDSENKDESWCNCKKYEKPGARFDAGFQYTFRGIIGLLASCDLVVACLPSTEEFEITVPEKVFYGFVGAIGAVFSFFSFRGLINVMRGVPLAHMIDDDGSLSILGKDETKR